MLETRLEVASMTSLAINDPHSTLVKPNVNNYCSVRGGAISNLQSNRMVYDFWWANTLTRLHEPKLAQMLAPKEPPHSFGAKRPSLEQKYYEVFNQKNLELVDINESPIETATKTGISIDSRHINLDILVIATGYDTITGELTSFEINGSTDQTLAKAWSTRVSTHLGVGVPGFPSLFMIYGALQRQRCHEGIT
jgi:cation diffusion facilitator CzcD-associated flavoprotein CzcO